MTQAKIHLIGSSCPLSSITVQNRDLIYRLFRSFNFYGTHYIVHDNTHMLLWSVTRLEVKIIVDIKLVSTEMIICIRVGNTSSV